MGIFSPDFSKYTEVDGSEWTIRKDIPMNAYSLKSHGGTYDEFTNVAWTDGVRYGRAHLCQIDFDRATDVSAYLMHPKENSELM